MADDPYEVAFGLILAAGNSRAKAFEAVEAAREGRFDDARALLLASEEEYKAAHGLHFGLLQKEANSEHIPLGIILVHALDHMSMALTTREHAQELIHVYSALAGLKKSIESVKENA